MRAEVIHVIATTLHRGQCNVNALFVHVRRSLVLGNPGRRAQIVFPWLESLELPELFVLRNRKRLRPKHRAPDQEVKLVLGTFAYSERLQRKSSSLT